VESKFSISNWPERFAKKIAIRSEEECWEWTAATHQFGYGEYHTDGRSKKKRAHRMAFELSVRTLMPGEYVLHTCDNPRCCNPNHLVAGTQADNMHDAWSKGRVPIAKKPNGSAHYKTKLTDDNVMAIRKDTRLLKDIAADYGVSIPTISSIRHRRNWKHI
jgi:hypothetical protein